MKVLVAMSGGVDSSVVAHMLKEQGHEVVGVRFTLWTDPLAPALATVLPSKCCNAQTVARANTVAKDLGIDLHILDLEEEFKKQVVDPFIEGYKAGKTPNPCIGCNRTVKFGRLLELREELGCDKLATGHYARVVESDGEFSLLEAADNGKDQSYYLYGLSQVQLSQVLFPLGDMKKSEVFALAKKYNVPLDDAHYRESQDLCFFPEKEPEAFLKRHIPDAKSGDIRLEDGEKVGTHKGMPFYTIGQRKGLGIGGLKIPLHVTRKDVDSNTIYVAPDGEDLRTTLNASDIRFIGTPIDQDKTVTMHARIHSLGSKLEGKLTIRGKKLEFVFNKGLRGIAAGQSIVFYEDDTVLGGATICD